MDFSKHRVIIGIGIIFAGILFLLKQIFFPQLGDFLWPFLLVGGGCVFLYFYFIEKSAWWAAIPGVILIAFGVAAALAAFISENVMGAIILGGISLAFIAVFKRTPHNWWAIIPAGILMTLAINVLFNWENGGLFLLGLAATFGILFIIPSSKQPWAIFPASILGGLGMVVLFISLDLSRYFIPLIVLGAGIFLIVKSLRES